MYGCCRVLCLVFVEDVGPDQDLVFNAMLEQGTLALVFLAVLHAVLHGVPQRVRQEAAYINPATQWWAAGSRGRLLDCGHVARYMVVPAEDRAASDPGIGP